MRILEVSETSCGGTLGILRLISAGAAAQGHDVLVALGERPETPPDLPARLSSDVKLATVDWGGRTPRDLAAAGRRLRRLADAWNPDVVHLHSSFAGAVGAVALAPRWTTIYTPHGSVVGRNTDGRLEHAAYRLAEGAMVRRATVVGAVSEAEARLLRRSVRAPRVTVVRNGIAELDEPPPPVPRRRRAPLVVAGGRLGPARRPAESARILASLADVAEVRWVGGAFGDEEAPLYAAGVPVTGWLSHEAALAHVEEATIYLHWSAWDGLPLAVLEAIARDVLVVASDIPANREIVGREQVRRTPEEAAALIRALLRDGERRERTLAQQRRRRGLWGAKRMVREWCELYERLGSGDAPRPRRDRGIVRLLTRRPGLEPATRARRAVRSRTAAGRGSAR